MADKPVNHARKTWLAIGLLIVLGLTFVSLGRWQLNRADERRAIALTIGEGRQSAAVTLTSATTIQGLSPWQSVTVSGTWLPQYSVLLDNRNLAGKPGLWLATPLRLQGQAAVLVLRGWVARPIGSYNPFPAIQTPSTPVTVDGELAARVPQLYELSAESPLSFVTLGSSPSEQTHHETLDLNPLPQRQNVSLTELSEVTGLQFLPWVVMQTDNRDGQPLARSWPEPSIDADTNMGYAMQWFGFSAIAWGAVVVLLWRLRRRAKIYTKELPR
jgi:surfeit locus 1 family protein